MECTSGTFNGNYKTTKTFDNFGNLSNVSYLSCRPQSDDITVINYSYCNCICCLFWISWQRVRIALLLLRFGFTLLTRLMYVSSNSSSNNNNINNNSTDGNRNTTNGSNSRLNVNLQHSGLIPGSLLLGIGNSTPHNDNDSNTGREYSAHRISGLLLDDIGNAALEYV